MTKKTPAKPRSKPQSNAGAILFRGSPEFKAWVERLATHDARPINSTIEVALIAHARAIGFAEPPPRRTRSRFGRREDPPPP